MTLPIFRNIRGDILVTSSVLINVPVLLAASNFLGSRSIFYGNCFFISFAKSAYLESFGPKSARVESSIDLFFDISFIFKSLFPPLCLRLFYLTSPGPGLGASGVGVGLCYEEYKLYLVLVLTDYRDPAFNLIRSNILIELSVLYI